MSIIFRFTERGDGGAVGPTRSGRSAIDREKSCLRLTFIAPALRLKIVAKFLPLAGLHLRHGYQAGALGRYWPVIVAKTEPATSWTQTALRGVRVGLGG
jgi:hypothetical protein